MFAIYEFGKLDGIKRPLIFSEQYEKYFNIHFAEVTKNNSEPDYAKKYS